MPIRTRKSTKTEQNSITIFCAPTEKHLSSYCKSRLLSHQEFCELEQKRISASGRKTEIVTDERTGFVALCDA